MQQGRLFPILALTTAALTVGLIIFGAVVRVTDSGLGCGNHWPSCNGTFFPPLDNITAWIEWLHRLFAALIGLFGIGMLAVAIAAYRKHNRGVLIATAAAAGLFTLQSGLGAFVVIFDLPPTMVTLHLGTAMLLLGALLLAGVTAIYQPTRRYPRDSFTTLAYITTALSLVIILTGALVRGSGATLACTDWPLCNGALFPFGRGQLAIIHMTHRVAVAALGIALVLLVWNAWRQRGSQRGIRWAAALALTVYLMQAAVGAFYVVSAGSPIFGAAHVGLAAATWALLIVLCIIEYLNTKETQQAQPTWQPQSKHALN